MSDYEERMRCAHHALNLMMGWSDSEDSESEELVQLMGTATLERERNEWVNHWDNQIREATPTPTPTPLAQPEPQPTPTPEPQPQPLPVNNDEMDTSSEADSDPEENEALSTLLDILNVRVTYRPGERPCKFHNCTTPTTKKYCVFHLGPLCSAENCQRKPWKGGRCRRHNNYVPPKCSVHGKFVRHFA